MPSSAGSVAAERLSEAAHAARRLCDALWDSLHEELSQPRPERVRALAERLADVSATIALLIDAPLQAEPASERAGVADQADPGKGADAGGSSMQGAGDRPPEPEASRHAPELGPDAAHTHPETPLHERRRPPDPVPGFPSEQAMRTRLVDEQAPLATVMPFAAAGQRLATVEAPRQEFQLRDARGGEGPSPWIESVGRMLARHAQDRLPFSVLLVEMVDVARLERSETPHDLHGLVAQVESALCRGMRKSDELSRETLGRYWLLAPETNGTGARMLAERLAGLVRTSTSHRGVPMEVAIGIAVCPQDGTEAPALAARADLGVYSARATGRPVAHSDPPSAS